MGIDFIPFAVFVIVTTFTPGPGNITSAAMGMNYGFKPTIQFLSGMVAGYFLIMVLCATLSSTMLRIIPTIEPILRIFGASYILWLAIGVTRTSYDFSSDESSPMVFKHGFLLQALNPKAIIFGLTIYTTFLSNINNEPFLLSMATIGLSLVTLCSISLWAFGGARIRNYLHMKSVRKWLNLVLAALLIYCSLTLSGIFPTS